MKRPAERHRIGNGLKWAVGLSSLLAWLAGAAEPADPTSPLIAEIMAGRLKQEPIPYLTPRFGAMSMNRAYEVQARLDARLSQALGPVVGYKVAYASKAAQEQFGVSEPARGSFFALQRIPTGSTISAAIFMEVLLETEVAFTIGKRIDHRLRTVGELRPYVKYVHAAFDIGDFRFAAEGPAGGVQDMVASGVGAHRFVLGPAIDPTRVDVDAASLKLARNGEVLRESSATEVLGSPWNSLLWLVNDVVKRGRTLEPGMVVLTGTAAKAYRAKGTAISGSYAGDCGALGKVTLSVK